MGKPELREVISSSHSSDYDEDKYVHVVYFGHYGGDDGYQRFLNSIGGSLKSLMWNRKVPVHIHLIGNNKSRPEYLAELIQKCNYAYFKVTGHVLPKELETFGFDAHKAKLLVEKTLAAQLPNVEKVIQLDGDVVVVDDIGQLWKLFDDFKKDQFFGLVPEFNPMYDLKDQHKYHGKQDCIHGVKHLGQTGFNTGVFLMDLHKMRSRNWWDAMMKVADDTKDCQRPMQDQDILNEYIYRDDKIINVLPYQWNMQLFCFADQFLLCKNFTTSKSSIIHYNGSVKDGNAFKYISDMYKKMDPSVLDVRFINELVNGIADSENLNKMRSHKNIIENPEHEMDGVVPKI
ncbi:glycosyltransferase-like protein [Acrasis kona]